MNKILRFKAVLTTLFVLSILFLGNLANAQVTTSSMSGVVTDEKGEGLPGATVMAVHEPTGSKYGATTRVDGRFNLVNLRVGGPYKVTITFVGNKDYVLNNIFLTLSEDFRFNAKMESNNQVLQEVKVTGSQSAAINANRTGASSYISSNTLRSLPTLSRSFTDFTRLDPRANGMSFAGRNPLYNNITVDGSYFNNAFGLQSTIGAQANATPISLDAIEQIQVNIAPYDVRQGMSTGASVNAVTRSGDNEFRGSVYTYMRNQNYVGKSIDGTEVPLTAGFDVKQYGFRIGGPLVKNKVFFFLSGEQESRTDPPGVFRPRKDGETASATLGISEAAEADLQKLKDFLMTKYNYNPGAYTGYSRETFSQKLNARLDFNLSDKHKLNIKYNYLKSYQDVNASNSGAISGGRGLSSTNIPFQGSLYRINNNLNSFIAELNSTFSNKIANQFQIGATMMRDFRESPAQNTPFPLVDIANGKGQAFTSFGYEPFSANNLLNSDIFQIQDNLTIYAGKNVLTFGAALETNSFKNGFAPNYYGGYQFASLQDFFDSAEKGLSNATRYQLQYSNISKDFPFAYMKGTTLSVYGQDEYTNNKGLKLTFGLRGDLTSFPIETGVPASYNPNVDKLNFLADGKTLNIRTDQIPSATLLLSPRMGFNWNVNNESKLQLRGGLGIFSGRVPYVWLSNQLSNNGMLFGSESTTNPKNRPFNPDVNAYIPSTINYTTPTGATAFNIAVTDKNFKFPQIFRANLAADKKFADGWIATLEGIFTKDINAVYHQNINLPNPTGTLAGPDNRPTWWPLKNGLPQKTTAVNRIYGSLPAAQGGNTSAAPNISDAILMSNTNLGYSYAITGEVKKQFTNGLYLSAAYTYTDAKSVNDGGSVAQSIWRDRPVSGNPNDNTLSWTNYLQSHRVVASGSYKFNYFSKKAATTLGFVYVIAPDFRYSYTYSGDINGDALTTNDLIYVPKDASEITFIDVKNTAGAVTYSAAQQSTDFQAYIDQDPYLSTRRGQYAERNGAVSPWRSSFDFKVQQDFSISVGGGKTNTLQLSLDIFNFGNALNSAYGLSPLTTIGTSFAGAVISPLTWQNFDAVTGKPTFTFSKPAAGIQSFQNSTGLGSRWQAQFGIRYIFN
jgi:Carboxypeptidase regulatory-like domain